MKIQVVKKKKWICHIQQKLDKKYKVAGYADKATGSASWNQQLSEKRAQVVSDALIAQGVDKDQLELVGFGGTENMFGKNVLNLSLIHIYIPIHQS